MNARLALADGEVFIAVSRALVMGDSVTFSSLDELSAWRNGAGAGGVLSRIQYFARTNSGWTFYDVSGPSFNVLGVARENPVKYFLDTVAKGNDSLAGQPLLKVEDDGEQFAVTIENVDDPVALLKKVVDWYKPEEHGDPLQYEEVVDEPLAKGEHRIYVNTDMGYTLKFASVAQLVRYARRRSDVRVTGVTYWRMDTDPTSLSSYRSKDLYARTVKEGSILTFMVSDDEEPGSGVFTLLNGAVRLARAFVDYEEFCGRNPRSADVGLTDDELAWLKSNGELPPHVADQRSDDQ